jgi:mRNA-degrading endonuclease RelE of RelBE toxin-antitoxin system
MAYEIVFAPEAIADFKRFGANTRATLRDAIETHLRYEPTKTSRSRIKRLRGMRRPQYRLRVGEMRVFYDIEGSTVEVLALLAKAESESWLAQFGDPE